MRTAEVIAAMCLATDLGMGFPFEHGLHATLTTMRLCDALDVDHETAVSTFYASLLMYAGCTVDGTERARLFGGSMTTHHTHRQFGSSFESLVGVARALPSPGSSLPRRAWEVVTGLPAASRFVTGHFAALCEVAGMLAERLGLPASISGLFPMLTERWDGASVLERASGTDVPLPLRIVHVGRDAAYQRLIGDDEHVVAVIGARAGKAFDPAVVAGFLRNADEILASPEHPENAWFDVIAAEPRPWLILDGTGIDRALNAIGLFSDMVSPYLTGHSSGVAALAGAAAEVAGMNQEEVKVVMRAGMIHDVGRSAIPSDVWGKPGSLTADEWEQVRLHPYHTERVLSRLDSLRDVAAVAGAHHERIDGSGYHRGIHASSLSPEARLLAAADAFHSKTETRPYRPSLSPEEAAAVVIGKARQGILDPGMVEAVVAAAGQKAPDIARPAGLTDREVEVLGHLARGLQTKQMARLLGISPKTVDRHIQNTYRKIGVSSRAAATLYATENGLVPRYPSPMGSSPD
jgi:response regulator RpfG family c-di-GMP phosphodiesterase/DNA-binding CsgD family transcriptional regulator